VIRFGVLMRLSDSCMHRSDRTLILSLARERTIVPTSRRLRYEGLREPDRDRRYDCATPWTGYEWVVGAPLRHDAPAPVPTDEVVALYQGLPAEAWMNHGLAAQAAA
jgi:hypothetical protein